MRAAISHMLKIESLEFLSPCLKMGRILFLPSSRVVLGQLTRTVPMEELLPFDFNGVCLCTAGKGSGSEGIPAMSSYLERQFLSTHYVLRSSICFVS